MELSSHNIKKKIVPVQQCTTSWQIFISTTYFVMQPKVKHFFHSYVLEALSGVDILKHRVYVTYAKVEPLEITHHYKQFGK